jgi:hypothetical protein
VDVGSGFSDTRLEAVMPAESKSRGPQLHVSVYLPGRKGRLIAFATEGPIELTPARMKLLAKLVEPDQWRRNLGSRRTNWEAVEAAVAKALS